jgi:hypothetical protein
VTPTGALTEVAQASAYRDFIVTLLRLNGEKVAAEAFSRWDMGKPTSWEARTGESISYWCMALSLYARNLTDNRVPTLAEFLAQQQPRGLPGGKPQENPHAD